MGEEELVEVLEEIDRLLDESPEMDEANTKAKIVQPLLEALGWTIASDAILEYGFQMGTTVHRVDFALTLDGNPVLFVEVKRARVDISDNHFEQISTYMKTKNVDWGLLTNVREFVICRRRVNDADHVEVDILVEATREELLENVTVLSGLSKEAIREGQAEEIATKVYRLREAYEAIETNQEPLVDHLTTTIQEEIGQGVEGFAEPVAREAVDELAMRLRKNALGAPTRDSTDVFWSAVESQTGILKQGSMLTFPDGKNATQCFTEFVDYLFEAGYLTVEDVPIESGRKRYLVNSEPVDKTGDEMYNPRTVGEEFYLETNYSKNDIKQQILELSELRHS